ncbi:hypothetical protein MP228_010323 [Amoeboaphelidium protococcarum]|nr:hypothetical protein MP228_010323 [Amoeboaphelidium protococcarum]
MTRTRQPQIQQGQNIKLESPKAADELDKNYDVWMKIASDNKINVKNSWSVHLIDYFHNLHLFKDTTGGSSSSSIGSQNGINFTKASCTLDGCVKVYSNRVDAVFTETGRLLSGLNGSRRMNDGEDDDAADNDDHGVDMDGDQDVDDDDVRLKRKKQQLALKKKQNRGRNDGTNNIEKNITSLNLKQLDLDHKCDPLFKKICAATEESGSNAFLLNHIEVHGLCQYDFDTTVPFSVYNTYEDLKVLQTHIDLSSLKEEVEEIIAQIPQTTLCPPLSHFAFSQKMSLDQLLEQYELHGVNTQEFDIGSDRTVAANPVVQVSQIDQLLEDAELENPSVAINDFNDDNMDYALPESYPMDEDEMPLTARFEIPDEVKVQLLKTQTSAFSYFDEQKANETLCDQPRWRKLRQTLVNGNAPESELSSRKSTKKSASTTAGKRSQFTLSFVDLRSKRQVSKLKVKSISKASKESTLIPMSTIEQYRVEDNLRSSKGKITRDQAFKLFLRDDIDVRSWKIYNRDIVSDAQSDHDYNGLPADIDDDEQDYVSPQSANLPMLTPDALSGQLGDSFGPLPIDEFQQQQNYLNKMPKLQEQPALNFSTKAKKVDVKDLKQRLWQVLRACSGGTDLQQAIRKVSSSYPPKIAAVITVPFYFICMLHLANEHCLRLKGTQKQDNVIITKDL